MSTNHLCSSLIDDSSRREQSKRRKVFISHERLSTNYPSSSLFAIKAERSQPAAASVGLVREKECVVWALCGLMASGRLIDLQMRPPLSSMRRK